MRMRFSVSSSNRWRELSMEGAGAEEEVEEPVDVPVAPFDVDDDDIAAEEEEDEEEEEDGKAGSTCSPRSRVCEVCGQCSATRVCWKSWIKRLLRGCRIVRMRWRTIRCRCFTPDHACLGALP